MWNHLLETLDIAQWKIVSPEKLDTSEVNPVIAPTNSPQRFSRQWQKGGNPGGTWETPCIEDTELRAWGDQGSKTWWTENQRGESHPESCLLIDLRKSPENWSTRACEETVQGQGKDQAKWIVETVPGTHTNPKSTYSYLPDWKTLVVHGTLGRIVRMILPQ